MLSKLLQLEIVRVKLTNAKTIKNRELSSETATALRTLAQRYGFNPDLSPESILQGKNDFDREMATITLGKSFNFMSALCFICQGHLKTRRL